jgi:hypothetical protein
MICQRCGTVFCWDDADEGRASGPKLYCSATCKHRKTPGYQRQRHRRRQLVLCRRQNKTAYDTELIATATANLLRRERRWSGYPYECACGSWHLTSQPPESRQMAEALKRALSGT